MLGHHFLVTFDRNPPATQRLFQANSPVDQKQHRLGIAFEGDGSLVGPCRFLSGLAVFDNDVVTAFNGSGQGKTETSWLGDGRAGLVKSADYEPWKQVDICWQYL